MTHLITHNDFIIIIQRLIELMLESGLPAGCLNTVHGSHDCVNFICDNEHIRSVSFVGGNGAGEHINRRAAGEHGKRVQSNMGAKNHGVVMPDANKNATLNQLVGAAFGAAGQRCMALPVAIFVGEARDWIPDLLAMTKDLKCGSGFDAGTDVGPVISPEAKARIEEIITEAVADGCSLLLDGRNTVVPGKSTTFILDLFTRQIIQDLKPVTLSDQQLLLELNQT